MPNPFERAQRRRQFNSSISSTRFFSFLPVSLFPFAEEGKEKRKPFYSSWKIRRELLYRMNRSSISWRLPIVFGKRKKKITLCLCKGPKHHLPNWTLSPTLSLFLSTRLFKKKKKNFYVTSKSNNMLFLFRCRKRIRKKREREKTVLPFPIRGGGTEVLEWPAPSAKSETQNNS